MLVCTHGMYALWEITEYDQAALNVKLVALYLSQVIYISACVLS